MSHSTPSGRRREGRNDFHPGLSPEEIEEVNPYTPAKSWFDQFHSRDWLDGWKEAEEAYAIVEAAAQHAGLTAEETLATIKSLVDEGEDDPEVALAAIKSFIDEGEDEDD